MQGSTVGSPRDHVVVLLPNGQKFNTEEYLIYDFFSFAKHERNF